MGTRESKVVKERWKRHDSQYKGDGDGMRIRDDLCL